MGKVLNGREHGVLRVVLTDDVDSVSTFFRLFSNCSCVASNPPAMLCIE